MRFTRTLGLLVVAALVGAVASAADEVDLELSPPRTLPDGGVWQYRVMRGADLTACEIENMRPVYYWYTVRVENLSQDSLTCSVKLTCGGRVCFPTTTTSAKAIIAPKGQATVIRACMHPQDTYQIDADCQQRAARTPLKVPPNCKYAPVGAVQLDALYPPASRRLREQGPVDLAFTLRDAEGAPSEVEVVGSSLYSRIDEAASKALRSLRWRTSCPGTRFETRLEFELDADGRGTVSLP
jgi:TonB family protein